MAETKVVGLDELREIVARLRARGQRVAHCHGVFDLLHVGHLRHFKEARRHADVVVVTVTPDEFVNKGPGRPAFREALRLEMLAALDVVDYVSLNRWPAGTEAIRLLRPDIYVKGKEYEDPRRDVTGKIGEEARAIADVGGTLLLTDDVVFSSSSLLNRHFPVVSEEVRQFIDTLRADVPISAVRAFLEAVRRLRVLVVGEAIIDEYHHCQTIGKSGKEPILAAQFVEAEKHAGGVLAIANHLAAFCDEVTLVTQLGELDSHEEFVRAHLAPSVRPHLLVQHGAPTIVKRRFVEVYPFQKLFEVYVIDEEQLPPDRAVLADTLRGLLPDADLVIAADYGHGLLEHEIVELLCAEARFLAVNTQKNAGNHGFNTVSKYRRADFVSISEGELRLDARTKTAPLEGLIHAVADRAQARQMIVTCGTQGCVCFGRERGIIRVPALTTGVRDRVGAGDAVFALTSLLAREGAPPAVLGLVGNAAGAQAVATIGNRTALDRVALLKHLEHLLK